MPQISMLLSQTLFFLGQSLMFGLNNREQILSKNSLIEKDIWLSNLYLPDLIKITVSEIL